MLREIWQSYWRLPVWVRIWTVGILGPVNFASILFLDHPMGSVIAMLSVGEGGRLLLEDTRGACVELAVVDAVLLRVEQVADGHRHIEVLRLEQTQQPRRLAALQFGR